MDAGGCRNERRCPPEETEGFWQHHVMESSSSQGGGGGREEESAPWRLVDVLLSGGAPWGFTLRGGREHREPLLITKVEEASRAAAVSLQVGDELVNINEIPLSGSRQEAICLVKGSHKTLALVVKRRSEPISRPHSWHATKFNESQPETTAKTQSPPAQVWHTRYDASSSSTDLSSGWEQTNLRRVSDQFSSLGSMDSLEHVSPHHPYPPTKSHNNSQEHLDPGGGGGKRDSAYSSFSTSSGTPDYTLSKSNAASTENMLYKVSQWDSAAGQQGGVAKHGGGGGARQHSLSEGAKQQDDRPGYLHVAGGGGGGAGGRDSPLRADSPQAGSRHSSSSSRASCGPVWHVPERKKATSSPSPPPPLPPVRSDSFAATKVVHERGLVIAYPESPETTHVVVYPTKAHEKAPEKRTEPADNAKRTAAESRRSHVQPPPKGDTDQFYFTPESYNQNQFGSNRQYSLSSSDVRLGGQPSQPYSQWHYTSGDKSTLYSQTKTVSVAKPTQNISGYYSSMQELPTAACSTGQLYGHNNHQARNSSNPTAVASSTPAVINQNPDSAAHRYYCVTARQPGGHPLLGKMTEDKKGAAGMELTQVSNDPQTVNKAKYQLPPQQLQQHIKNTNGYGKQEDGLCHKQTPVAASPAAMPETLLAKPASDDRGGGQRRLHSQNAENLPYVSKQPEQRRSLPATLQQQQRELPQEVRRPKQDGGAAQICPRTTPMLHSLSAETAADRDAVESLEGGKQVRRAERFATTLRNEIQMRRAKLQKSMSAAALTGAEGAADPEGNDDDDDVWKSKGGSAPTSYKDNLKEAQARVLKATSFRRRDLEPVLLEHPSSESSSAPPPAYSAAAALRKDLGSLPTVSESLAGGKAGPPPPVTRIGGRKRFPAEKKARSFSEPDKIHEVGTTEEATPSENNQRKHFEVAGKPAFPKPPPPMQYYYEDPKEANSTVLLGSTGQPEGPASAKGIQCRAVEYGVTEDQSALHSVLHGGTQTTTLLEQQRLGTFAEYEARWNVQKKAGETTRASGGRYHSADNILDPGPGEEVTKPSCFHHERSRSSPSADFYRQQKAPAPGRKSAEYSQQEEECQAVAQSGSDASSSDRGGVSDSEQPRGGEEEEEQPRLLLPAEPVERFPPPMTGPPNPDAGSRPPATSVYHRPPSVSHSPPTDLSVPSSEAQAQAQQPGPPGGGKKKKKAPVPLPKPDAPSKRPEVAAAPSDPPAIAPHHRSSVNGGFGSSHSPETAGGGGGDRGHGATNPQPASPPTAPPRSSSSSHGPPALPPPPPPPPPALAAMDGHRSPSPQFSPQRLSDKPPLSLQDECCNRTDSVMENNDNNNRSSSAVRKVPIKIVHSESVSEKESRQYLLHSSDDGVVVAPPAMECQQGGVPPSPGTTTTAPLPRLGGSAEQQDYSVFCAYTRQRDHHPQSGGDPPLLLPPPDANGDHANNGSGLGLALCQEDQKREELVRDITVKDRSLADILDQSNMMTTMDLMEGIFPGGQQLLEEAHQHHHHHHNHHQRRKAAPKQTPAEDREDDSVSAAMGVVTSSTYYSTSAPKAEMLIKMKDMQEEEEEDSEDELDVDLANKKQELMDSLSRKLQVLREARESLQEDILDNKALGDEVEATVQALCKPNELDKFRMFVGDLDKVVSLLLSLSGRLARVENALNSPDEDTTPEERRTLTDKRKLLIRQHEDAKELKDNLDRREGVVYDIVASYLDEDGLADYQHFVKMKSALIIEQRKLEDKIKLGDEQLKCLMDSLPLEQRLSL